MSKFGVDVSQHQGTINWENAKSKIDFAILRLGWICNKNNHTLDTQFERNYSECKRLGIPVGVYVYCYASSIATAKSGANWTVQKLSGKSLDLPVYLDMEDTSIASVGKDTLTEICFEFNTIIENAGFWAGVYANRNWFDNYLHKENIKSRFTTWIATYTTGTNKYEGEYDVWQNSSSGKITGISGNVDTNYMYRDLVTEVKGNTTTPAKKTIDEIVDEVIAGMWGNGAERQTKLTQAGYDYFAVQTKINSKLASSSAYYPACGKGFVSLVTALNSIKVNSSYDYRAKIAIANNIHDYTGTAQQNNQLLSKLKAGRLRKI